MKSRHFSSPAAAKRFAKAFGLKVTGRPKKHVEKKVYYVVSFKKASKRR